jgi:cell division protein FtsA
MLIHIMGKGIKKYRKSDKKTLSDIKDFLLLWEIRKFVSYSIKPTIHMATNDMIVAVELGSSKISGAVGRKRADGSLQVLAYASEPVAGFVRRGVVYNIDQTAQCLSNLINRLEPELGNYTIDQLYVGVGGYTLHSQRNTVARSFEEETRVTDTLVDEMEEENAGKQYPGYGMMLMVSQEYKIGNNLLNDPVGVNCTTIEGNYLNILTRTSVMHNMAKSFEIAKINIAHTAIPPLVAANVLLTDCERRQGCALLDFGAETTTTSVFKRGNLRFLTVIPIGSQTITRDLCSLQLDEEEAERLKREYGLHLPALSD